jgi:hypothetical protein
VIRVYDDAGNVIETHEHKGDFKEWSRGKMFATTRSVCQAEANVALVASKFSEIVLGGTAASQYLSGVPGGQVTNFDVPLLQSAPNRLDYVDIFGLRIH